MMLETEEKAKARLRKELLTPLGVKDLFSDGEITINKKTCEGVECKLCIKVCPTNALFWKAGEVGITRELCIYCGACILSCIVDDCIEIERKRADGNVERFSRPKTFIALQNSINARRRHERVGARARNLLQGLFPNPQESVQELKSKRKNQKRNE